MYFLIFAASLLFLIIAANYLVRSTEKLASSLKISPLVIGATAVAVGTSLPELSVTISSISEGASSLGVGNIIGSNISNIFLITGLLILLFPIRVGTEKTQRNNLINLAITGVFIASFFVPLEYKNFLYGALFISYFVFFIIEIIWGEMGGKKEDKKNLSKLQKTREKPLISLAKIAVAIIVLLSSSRYTVSSALEIAKFFKLDNEVIGLTLIAIGTSLPELVSCVVSGLKKDWKLIMGDVQGSNVFNLGVLGSIILRYSKDIKIEANIVPLAYLLISTLFIGLLTRKYEGTNIPRYYGLIFLLLYSSYLILVLV